MLPAGKKILESQSYLIKGEVNNCDVIARRNDEEPIIIELKLSINLTVILQAVDRLALSSKVYIGIPKTCKTLAKQRKRLLKLLRMLGLGLILIDTCQGKEESKESNKSVEVVLDPKAYQPRQSNVRQERLLGELEKRVGDPNLGGTATKQGVVTAYRQQALRIADYLKVHGATKASAIASALEEPKARKILYKNFYGWFENTSRGIYQLSPRGIKELASAKPASS